MLPRSISRARILLVVGLVLCLAGLWGPTASAAAKPRPDLTASKGSVGFSGGKITGKFTVRNAGKRPARASTAYVQAKSGANFRTVTELRILKLGAGKSAKYAFTAKPLAGMEGAQTLRVCLDVKKKVAESKEGNNCSALGKVTVGEAPLAPPGPITYTPDTRFLVGTKAMGYYGWVPGGYDDSHQTPSALFVWLHGCGGFSEFDIDGYKPETASSYVMIAPTGRESGCWSTPANGPGDDALVLRTIRDVITHFNIDKSRIVLGGYSSGGDLAYRLAYRNSGAIDAVLATNTSPFRDTGLTSAQALAAATTKFRVVHLAHTEDTTYPIAGVRTELQALTGAGFAVTKVERAGTHYDNPAEGLPGTAADIRSVLLPQVDP